MVLPFAVKVGLVGERVGCRDERPQDGVFRNIADPSLGWACINVIDPSPNGTSHEPPTTSLVSSALASGTSLGHDRGSHQAEELQLPAMSSRLSEFSSSVAGVDGAGFPLAVPPKYRPLGLFWYASQLTSFLARPNAFLRAALAEAKASADWAAVARPLLALHVRRGDSCSAGEARRTARACEPLAEYMARGVLPLAAQYGIKSIFLATDDLKTVKQTKRWPQFSWHFQPSLYRGRETKRLRDHQLRHPVGDPFLEAMAMLTDLFLMAEADAFVGKFTSNMDRLAMSLLVTRKKGLVPFVSLDSKWCSDWGRATGEATGGPFRC